MADEQITVEVWEISPAEEWCASLLARCLTQTEAAEQMGIDARTVRRWWSRREFREYVRDLERAIQDGYDEEFAGLIADSLRCVRSAVRGEIDAGSARVQLAQDTLARTAYRIAVRQADDRASSLPAASSYPQLPAGADS